jgi:hypothetical protein
MCGSFPPVPHMSSWHGAWLRTGCLEGVVLSYTQGQLYITVCYTIHLQLLIDYNRNDILNMEYWPTDVGT